MPEKDTSDPPSFSSPDSVLGESGSSTSKIRVEESHTGGKGVFANRRFRPEDVIGPILGTIVSEDHEPDSSYTIDIRPGFLLLPEAPFRFLNHCCKPNCEVFGWEPDDKDQLWLEVLRDILPGEELTIDYRWPALHAIPCLCGHAECRGWIVDPAELDLIEEQTEEE